MLLNLVLAALIVVLGLRVRDAWTEARKRERVVLGQRLKQLPAPPFTPLRKPEPVQAIAYAPIAQEMLWTPDRNPTVVVVAVPPPPMPALPAVYGVYDVGDGLTAIMAVKAGEKHEMVKQGEKIGEFTVAELGPEALTLHWRDKIVTKKIEELVDHGQNGPKEAAQSPAAGPARAASPAAAPAVAQVNLPPGGEKGDGSRYCQPNDATPAGTVQNGLRKVVRRTPFGQSCSWDPVK